MAYTHEKDGTEKNAEEDMECISRSRRTRGRTQLEWYAPVQEEM